MTAIDTSHSLRRRLLGYLLGAILLAAMAQAVTTYFTALSQADVIFDQQMQKMAESLRSGVPLSSSPNTEFNPDRGDEDFVVQMWTLKGDPIFQSAAHQSLRHPSKPGFSALKALDGRVYRVFVLNTPRQVIQIAQDMAARSNMARTLALRTVGPILLMAPALMLMVWWAVGQSLAPIAQVRSQMAARKADDLSSVSEVNLPDEVRPLIQELNLLFDRLRQAFDAQKSFVADAAHELRSPLAALKIQIQGLQRATDETAQQTAIKRLTAGIDRATHLVDQLLVLARQEASTVSGEIQDESIDLSQTCLMVLTDTLLAAQTRGIDLGVHRADAVLVMGRAEALRILVRNLLDNAVKYTPSGGIVDMDIRQGASGAVLSVEDSGPGIPENDRLRVLDRFYRVSGSGLDGSGLGLAIVKAIADQHGATVLIDRSERLGGLRVQVSFQS